MWLTQQSGLKSVAQYLLRTCLSRPTSSHAASTLTSSTMSPALTLAACTMSTRTPSSVTKFWPRDLQHEGRHKVGWKLGDWWVGRQSEALCAAPAPVVHAMHLANPGRALTMRTSSPTIYEFPLRRLSLLFGLDAVLFEAGHSGKSRRLTAALALFSGLPHPSHLRHLHIRCIKPDLLLLLLLSGPEGLPPSALRPAAARPRCLGHHNIWPLL